MQLRLPIYSLKIYNYYTATYLYMKEIKTNIENDIDGVFNLIN